MKNIRFAVIVFAMAMLAPLLARAQEGPLDSSEPKGISTDEIIRRFAGKEKEFKLAREAYTYRQTLTVQTMDGRQVDGEFQEVVDVLFDNKGRRMEQVVYAPQSSLRRIQMTREDFDDIQHRLPFVLTSDEVPEYQIMYVGQQQEDELHTYVFDVAPLRIEKDKRYFQGRIWVDDHDFQIVKTKGKNVPDIRKAKRGEENLFPEFTTWREQIDSQDGTGRKFWFPTYTKADDDLHFSGGDVHIREIVKYTNYKRFGANVKITYEGQQLPTGPETKTPQGQQQAQPPASQPPAQKPGPPGQN